jgi:hypothetical protein
MYELSLNKLAGMLDVDRATLKFVSRSWFNLDATWAVSLILVGTLALAISLAD